MRGRFWFGRGFRGMGRGRGNPYPFCRFNPSLPRRWWAYRPGVYSVGMGGFYPQAVPSYYPRYSPYQW